MIPLRRLVVASKNPDKVAEMREILDRLGLTGEVVTGLDWADVEETGETLEANALLKARAVMASTGVPALADDTGLEVAALGGAPGVRSARYAGPGASYSDNLWKLLADLDGVDDRRARFRTVVALVDVGGSDWVAEGVVDGSICHVPRGEGGFGYDPVFEVDGLTLAEMAGEKKNAFSHRARALEALARLLRDPGRAGRT